MTDAVRSCVEERRYSTTTLERWLTLEALDAQALVDLVQELRPSENQLRDLWDWAEEIGHRDGLSLTQVLALEAPAKARRSRNLGRNDKLKVLKNALRRLRFPQLAATEERLAALVRELDLPRNVRITFPEFLEGDEVRVEIVADTPASLERAAERLRAAAHTPACHAMFQLLGEAS